MIINACSWVADKIRDSCKRDGSEKEVKGITERECVLSGKPIASNGTTANGYGYPTKDEIHYRQNGQMNNDTAPACRQGGGG